MLQWEPICGSRKMRGNSCEKNMGQPAFPAAARRCARHCAGAVCGYGSDECGRDGQIYYRPADQLLRTADHHWLYRTIHHQNGQQRLAYAGHCHSVRLPVLDFCGAAVNGGGVCADPASVHRIRSGGAARTAGGGFPAGYPGDHERNERAGAVYPARSYCRVDACQDLCQPAG